MKGDSLTEAIKSIVRRVLEETNVIDFRALYPARVVSVGEDGREVDVSFDDERLKSKTGVKVVPMPGLSIVLKPGTRVLIGWKGGNGEEPPVAHLMWDGNGGVSKLLQKADDECSWDTPLGKFSGELQAAHLLSGSSYNATSAIRGEALGTEGTVTDVSGGDIIATVTCLTDQNPTTGTMFRLTFKKEFKKTPQVLLVDENGAGATYRATTRDVTVSASAALKQATSYRVTMFFVGQPS